jgi:hypothetical protein
MSQEKYRSAPVVAMGTIDYNINGCLHETEEGARGRAQEETSHSDLLWLIVKVTYDQFVTDGTEELLTGYENGEDAGLPRAEHVLRHGYAASGTFTVWSRGTRVRPGMPLDEADRAATELSEGNAGRRTYYEVRDQAGRPVAGYCQGRKADGSTAPRVEVRKDNKAKAWFAATGAYDTNALNNAWTYIQKAQGQSVEWAMRHEGWFIAVIDAEGQEYKEEAR